MRWVGFWSGQGSQTRARVSAASCREVSLAGSRKKKIAQIARGKLRNCRQDLELIGPSKSVMGKENRHILSW